jgi:hypothetical protein
MPLTLVLSGPRDQRLLVLLLLPIFSASFQQLVDALPTMSARKRSDLDGGRERELAPRSRNAAPIRVDLASHSAIGQVALTCALAPLVDALTPDHSVRGAGAATASG